MLDKRRDRKGQAKDRFYLKLVHTIETLLHTLSDQQLITSIALLLSINHQACTISAYHYNLVCTMLLMGIITHLNTLINIPDFLYKGKTVAFYRFFGICVQLILSGFVFSARHTKTFPSKASSLAIMAAACFENMNATDDLGFSDFFTFAQNVTSGVNNTEQLLHNIDAATSATTGLGEYATLVAFMLIAILVLVYDFFEAQSWLGSNSRQIGLRLSTIFFSFASIVSSVIIIAVALTRYNTLRSQMEVPKWYNNGGEDEWTYSQILPILLLGSGSIAVLKAITGTFLPLSPALLLFIHLMYTDCCKKESFGGIRGRRYEPLVKAVAQDVGKNAQNDDHFPMTDN